MIQKIEVVQHSPEWENSFALEADRVQEALGKNCIAVHHIGSTAVPDLLAKPVIDIMPIVKELAMVDRSYAKLRHMGYEAKGEAGVLFRRYFSKGGDRRTHHLHVFEHGHPEIQRHLCFRDWLRDHPTDKQTYGDLKQRLAKEHPNNTLAYTAGKDSFVANIAKKTEWQGKRVVLAYTSTEWRAYHELVEKYLFMPNKIEYNQNHHCIISKKNFHFIQYKGWQIITAAHIEFLHNEIDVALRWLVSHPQHANQGNSKTMLNMLETWCKQQGRLHMKMHATAIATPFFRHMGHRDEHFDDTPLFPNHTDLGKDLCCSHRL